MSTASKVSKAAKTVLATALAFSITAPLALSSAQAGDRYGHRYQQPAPYAGYNHYRRPAPLPPHRSPVVRQHNNGDLAAVAVLGIIGGAIIGGALAGSQTRNHQPAPVYRAPQPSYNTFPVAPPKPQPGHYQSAGYGQSLAPWSQGWYNWCDNRYRSFNPQTGTFRGYDGQDHFCVPK